jgi:hypothetical protein
VLDLIVPERGAGAAVVIDYRFNERQQARVNYPSTLI